jgi:hypothetical protein
MTWTTQLLCPAWGIELIVELADSKYTAMRVELGSMR